MMFTHHNSNALFHRLSALILVALECTLKDDAILLAFSAGMMQFDNDLLQLFTPTPLTTEF